MVIIESREKYTADDLLEIVSLLRSPSGCPWEAEQTHQSIRRNMVEEAYEAAEAIDRCDKALLCEELGDVLLQVVFHASIAADAGDFTFDDIADGICKKLIVRHPHVFSDVQVSGSSEVIGNWEEIKRNVKGYTTLAETLRGVSAALPGLMRLQKMANKCVEANMLLPEGQGFAQKLMALALEANAQDVDLETVVAELCRAIIMQAEMPGSSSGKTCS